MEFENGNIGAVIKRKREIMGLSQDELAAGIVPRLALVRLESNQVFLPMLAIERLLSKLDIGSEDINEFYQDFEDYDRFMKRQIINNQLRKGETEDVRKLSAIYRRTLSDGDRLELQEIKRIEAEADLIDGKMHEMTPLLTRHIYEMTGRSMFDGCDLYSETEAFLIFMFFLTAGLKGNIRMAVSGLDYLESNISEKKACRNKERLLFDIHFAKALFFEKLNNLKKASEEFRKTSRFCRYACIRDIKKLYWHVKKLPCNIISEDKKLKAFLGDETSLIKILQECSEGAEKR